MSLSAEQPCSIVPTTQCVQHIPLFHMLPYPTAQLRAHKTSHEATGSPQDPHRTTRVSPWPLLCEMWGPLVRVARPRLLQGGLEWDWGAGEEPQPTTWERWGEIWEGHAPRSCKGSAGVVWAGGPRGVPMAGAAAHTGSAPEVAPAAFLAAEAASPSAPTCGCRFLPCRGRG